MSHIIVFIFKSVLVDIKPLPAFLLVHICLESHFFNLSYPCISNIIIVSNLSSSITLLFNPRVCLLNSEFNLLILFLLLSCRCFFMLHFYLPCFFVCVFLLFYLFWLSKFLNQFESYIFSLCYSYLYSIKTYIQIFSLLIFKIINSYILPCFYLPLLPPCALSHIQVLFIACLDNSQLIYLLIFIFY